ncbi:MAG: protein-glutamate O-methyltransferase CheR [Acidobacteria bacterium]|nr:protein-glutamate O-methyltransferase CheR [Acidobacteriota bacterium]
MATFAIDADPRLTATDMTRIVELVYRKSGITLHDGKRALVVARLQKRLRALGLPTFAAYVDHVERDATGSEIVALLDAIATNHTYFFREDAHFTFLRTRIAAAHGGAGRPLEIWSAACSTGEEPYSIAITLLGLPSPIEFSILASDLSTRALAAAGAGVYKQSALGDVPRDILRAWFERGLGPQEGLARIAAPVRRCVTFRQLNLLELGELRDSYDVIFCRNVMIYFDRAVQQRVVSALERRLRPGGHLLISHSESLNGVAHSLRWVAPAIYQRGNH